MDQSENQSIVLGRQPIFDRQYNVYAYELLFRSDPEQNASLMDNISGDLATSQVINHAFLDFGIERVIGDNLAFVNLTRNFALSDDPMPFVQDRVVLELLEDIEVDDELIEGVKQLVNKGYTVALDDFIFNESLKPMIELASIIKADIRMLSDAELAEHVEILKQYDVKLLAEKVETKAEFDRCLELGFDYFQGYFFCHPEIMEDKPIPNNHLKLLQIIQQLQDPDIEIEDIEKLVAQDAKLAYRLLRLLNSPVVGVTLKIDSLKRGLVILGLKAIKTWLTMIAINEIGNLIPELVNNTLVRAKMAEQMAEGHKLQPDSCFLIGLFSTLDVMLHKPMGQVISQLPINEEIKLALITREGTAGKLLQNIIYFEQGKWDKISHCTYSLEQLSEYYISATQWAFVSSKSWL